MANTLELGNGKWATGKDTVLAFNDENNNFKPLPFSFSRDTSGTVVNKEGLIETVGVGEPRIEFKDNTKGALLLEPTRGNLFPYSEDFENSDWTKNAGTTITNNYAISPDGSLNASRYLGTGTSGLGDKFTLSATSYTLSFYVKSNTSENQYCRLIGDSSNVSENLLITTEWTRLSYTFTGSGLSNKTNGIFRDSSDNDIDILIYGAQLEQGSYATSYIPTSVSAVTRVADSSSQTVPDGVIGQTEGSVFLDFKPQTLDATSRYLSVENSSSVSNGWMGIFAALSSSNIRFRFYGDGWDFNSTLIIEKDKRYKIAFSYKNGVQTSVYVNGNLIGNLTASLSGKSFQKIRLSEATFGVRGDAEFKDLKLYNTALTDQELIALTQ